MRLLIIIFSLFYMLNAEELNFLNEDSKKHYKPLRGNTLYQYIPLIKTIRKARIEKKEYDAKIAENFTDKSQLKEVKKKDVKVKVDTKEVDFFDSLDGADTKVIDMEK